MIRIALFLVTATTVFGLDNQWAQVQEIKSRTELRIYRKGVREPINATMDDANEERILVVVKNHQLAIPKEEIDRLDARPATKGSRKVTPESKVKTTYPDNTPHPNNGVQVPRDSWSGGFNLGSGKPDFETVYRRTPESR